MNSSSSSSSSAIHDDRKHKNMKKTSWMEGERERSYKIQTFTNDFFFSYSSSSSSSSSAIHDDELKHEHMKKTKCDGGCEIARFPNLDKISFNQIHDLKFNTNAQIQDQNVSHCRSNVQIYIFQMATCAIGLAFLTLEFAHEKGFKCKLSSQLNSKFHLDGLHFS
jgi:hypothetical protein